MKKIILLTILSVLNSVSLAQNITQISGNQNNGNQNSGNVTLDNAMNQAKNQSGSYNSKVANPFSFCSAAKPGKGNPMRVIWEQICPAGNAQPAAAPVPVPTQTPPNTKDLQELKERFNQKNNVK